MSLLLILLIAVVTDIRHTKIRNRLILCGWTVGLVFRILGDGYAGILYAILNSMIPVVLLILLFQMHALGAGDIKLFSVTGSFLTTEQLMHVMAVSFVIAAVLGMGKVLYLFCAQGGKKEKWTKMHFSIAIMAAVVVVGGRCMVGQI